MTATAPVRFQRATLVVRALERSLAFYEGVLGFVPAFVKPLAETSYSYEAFGLPRGTPLRFAALGTADQQRTLGLIEWNDPAFQPPAAPRTAALVIAVDDFDGAVARAAALGCAMLGEDRLVTHDGRIGREQAVFDPDGHLVLLFTITAAAPGPAVPAG